MIGQYLSHTNENAIVAFFQKNLVTKQGLGGQRTAYFCYHVAIHLWYNFASPVDEQPFVFKRLFLYAIKMVSFFVLLKS